ncbi:MAG: hypothetical protein JXA82_17360 [Sedimentisphaerales bacterium]|nr:hypothetical protein [Sedimentisphaerales bacterium]
MRRVFFAIILVVLCTCTFADSFFGSWQFIPLSMISLPEVPPGYYVEPYATGFKNVNAIAFSPGGDFGYEGQLFVADSRPDPGTIYRVPGKEEEIVFAQAADNEPRSLEFAPLGSEYGPYLYATHSSSIYYYDATGVRTKFADIPAFGMDLAFASDEYFRDHLFQADARGRKITEWTHTGTQEALIDTLSMDMVTGLDFGPGGEFGTDLYITFSPVQSSTPNSAIRKITPEGVMIDFLLSSEFSHTNQLAFDRIGDFDGLLYVSDRGNDVVYRIDAQANFSVFASGFSFTQTPYIKSDGGDIVFGPDGAMYIADGGAGIVWRIAKITGNLTQLEIIGPDQIVEGTDAEYRALAHFDDGVIVDVTDQVIWSITPEELGDIDKGQLTVVDIEKHTNLHVNTCYEYGSGAQSSQKVQIFALCPTGSALQFDGQNDFAFVPRSESLEPGEITIEMWIYVNGLQSRNTRLLRKLGHVSDGYMLAVDENNNERIHLAILTGGLYRVNDIQSYKAYIDQWHHIAASYGETSASLYIDGIQAASVNHNRGMINNSPVDLFFGSGRPSGDSSEYFKGYIDEIRIWNYIRGENQIYDNMHKRLTGQEPGLVGYWTFDEGQGKIVHDLSPFENHGFLGTDAENQDDSDPVWIISDAPVGICDIEEPELENTYHVDAALGNDENSGLNHATAFATIGRGIETAEEGWTVLVWPGTYLEEVDFQGKAITVRGTGGPVIDADGGFGVSFYNMEGPASVLENVIITNSQLGVFLADSDPTLRNLTIVGNHHGIAAYADADPNVTNSILWENTGNDLLGCEAAFSCIEDANPGWKNITNDPLFADSPGGDYRLLSRMGRWNPAIEDWVLDDITSPCIDAGNPLDDPTGEPMPSGGRINMGAFGGTDQASKSANPWPNPADLNHDGQVNLTDIAILAENWLWTASWLR